MSRAHVNAKLPPGCHRANPVCLMVIQKCFQAWNILSALKFCIEKIQKFSSNVYRCFAVKLRSRFFVISVFNCFNNILQYDSSFKVISYLLPMASWGVHIFFGSTTKVLIPPYCLGSHARNSSFHSYENTSI